MIVSSLLFFVVVTVHRTRRLPLERLDATDILGVAFATFPPSYQPFAALNRQSQAP